MATKLITADDVATRWNVPRSWVYARAREGSIPHVRLGRYVRFDPDLLDQFIVDQYDFGNNENGAAPRQRPAPGTGEKPSHAPAA